ncbi:senecionine N-oxygenase-like [Danaus plexippus]|uniref:senecionine N-oxygenase-like n=1 Tax=Danaus plexippus TaxID=13037 RepID=UPI002AB122E7|nr:senecionine N-oxygenase-like [Danaus plexippus]
MFYISLFFLCLNIILHTNGLVAPANPYTCVIGAGYSGLAAARYLQQYGLKFTVFERTKYVGGTWRFDPHIGVDEDGVPVSTSQYKYLKINSPRQTMEYDGYPFPDDTPSFVSGVCFYNYIKSFVKQFDLMKNIQLRSYVKSVKRLEDTWELTYTRTDTNENDTVYCDFVVVAIGQYNKPHVGKFSGLDEFEGTVIHSHDYKCPETYKNSNVLVVGGGPSGLDIAIQLQKVAKKIVHSHHLRYNEPQLPENYVKKPDIKNFVRNGVFFNDTSFEELDHVILATGYRIHHPFLDRSSGLLITNKYLMPLHNQVINIREPSLMFIGISKQYINKILNAQAEYIALFIAGKFELPSEEEMLEMWMTKHSPRKLKDVNSFVTEPLQYFQNLTAEAGVTRLPPVILDIILNSIHNLLDDILHYRDYDFQIIDSENYKSWRNYNVTEDRFNNCTIQDIDL